MAYHVDAVWPHYMPVCVLCMHMLQRCGRLREMDVLLAMLLSCKGQVELRYGAECAKGNCTLVQA